MPAGAPQTREDRDPSLTRPLAAEPRNTRHGPRRATPDTQKREGDSGEVRRPDL